MKGNMEDRACALALYIIENRATVRAAAQRHIRGGLATREKYLHLHQSAAGGK